MNNRIYIVIQRVYVQFGGDENNIQEILDYAYKNIEDAKKRIEQLNKTKSKFDHDPYYVEMELM